jgi:hypothetical protein
MRKSLITFVAASSVAFAAMTAPTTAEARWRGWGAAYYGYYAYPAYYSYGYYPRHRYYRRYPLW